MWLEDATGTTYIGSRDKYYIDDYGNLQEYSDPEAASSSWILQKNRIPALPPIPVKTPHRILIPLNRKNVASFICGLVSLPMILSENPCPKKEVISSNVP